ncbi:MAG: AmmeMemoRadiSam system radical SAM enzyme [Proteobacteria bacterium]|nr:AmmeMemoRadiSam system radical SAM enzyme [Pseudomonadota bacterium]
MSNVKERLNLTAHPARLYTKLENGEVICHLSPRQCRMKPGQAGFCRVRQNENGELVTLNYGVSVQLTQEMIETEAVVHHSPGQPILSLGNIGCMLNCDFCHNWQTSQVRFVKKKDIQRYTPEQVVETALNRGIGILSWTYNDPVVWHEFVCDTARLARQHGLLNLYKSAFYISPQAIDELHEVIDIFSLSLKSMDPTFYRRVAKGRLEPVLEGIKQVYSYGDRHLEISNLIVTGMNDSMEEVEKVVHWMLKELDETVPLHLVRFHPDYKYTHVERTSVEFLKKARLRALEMGIKHCYLGNVYEEHEGLNTSCAQCGNVLVKRFGLQTQLVGINEAKKCKQCNRPTPLKFTKPRTQIPTPSATDRFEKNTSFLWNQDINACHVILENLSSESRRVVSRQQAEKVIQLSPGEQWRFICSKQSNEDKGVELFYPGDVEVKFVELLDRAHYPV